MTGGEQRLAMKLCEKSDWELGRREEGNLCVKNG